MESSILSTESQKDLNLIPQIVRKLGISTKNLTKEEIKEYDFSIAIKEGKTGKFIDTGSFLNKISKMKYLLISLIISIVSLNTNAQTVMKYKKLTSEEERVIINKGTEMPFTGKYLNFDGKGTYVCKNCGSHLYFSKDKFESHCGWPSFDDEIPDAVKRIPDADGIRTEIVCANCGGHLGHVFKGEKYTEKNIRHCVNSISIDFIPVDKITIVKTGRAIFAGGCFWGMEHLFNKANGVISTDVGYMGGDKNNPTYEEVCSDNTNHAEAIEVIFDNSLTSFEEMTKLFFEIHDPTQVNRQGPDIGSQYRSVIFYLSEEQRVIAEKLINTLEKKGYDIATEVTKATTFWKAENYHQDYYSKNGKEPYCHSYIKRF